MRFLSLLAASALLAAPPVLAQATAVAGPGDPALDVSFVEPGTAPFTMTVVQGPLRQPIGGGTATITIDEEAGVIESVTSMNVMGQKMADTTRAAWPSLAALSHRSENPERALSFTVTDGTLTGEHRPAGGTAEAFEASLDGPIFDSAWIGTLAAMLPLAEGFSATIPAYEYEAGGLTTYTLSVVGQEKRTREGAAPVDVWIVEASREGEGGQTIRYLFAQDSHDLVGLRLAPQPGVEVLVDFEAFKAD